MDDMPTNVQPIQERRPPDRRPRARAGLIGGLIVLVLAILAAGGFAVTKFVGGPDDEVSGPAGRLESASAHKMATPGDPGAADQENETGWRNTRSDQPAEAEPAPRRSAAVEIHVAPNGSDSADGTASAPLRTLEAARDRIRTKRGDRAVVLHAGTYELRRSLRLTSADSGTANAPITYRAAPGEKAVISGAHAVPNSAIKPVQAEEVRQRLDPAVRDRVRQVSLGEVGVADTGEWRPEVTGADVPATVQLIQGETVTHDARYPDRGKAIFIKEVPSQGDNPTWRIEDPVPFTWRSGEDLWVEGFPGFNWAWQKMRVTRLDKQASTVTLGSKAEFGSGPNQTFAFVNVLEGLNQTDEIYTDTARGVIYFLPTGGPVAVTKLSEPLVVGEGVSHVQFEGIDFTGSRGDGVRFKGGTNIAIRRSAFTDLGLRAITLKDVTESSVDFVRIDSVGRGGIDIGGGDRRTLASGRNVVSNCRIERFSERYPRYSPAVLLSGVGTTVEHNEIAHAPHTAIQIAGNDHKISANYIHDVVESSTDSGAIYGGRDWSERGNVISDNVFARIGLIYKDNIAVYLDDMMSGTVVERNLFVDVPVGIQHSGRDNKMVDNVFVRTQRPVYIGRWGGDLAGPGQTLQENLKKVPYQSPAYAKYANLATILTDEPALPKYNTLVGSRFVESGPLDLAQIQPGWLEQNDNTELPRDAVTTGERLADYRFPKRSALRQRPGPDLAAVGPPG